MVLMAIMTSFAVGGVRAAAVMAAGVACGRPFPSKRWAADRRSIRFRMHFEPWPTSPDAGVTALSGGSEGLPVYDSRRTRTQRVNQWQ